MAAISPQDPHDKSDPQVRQWEATIKRALRAESTNMKRIKRWRMYAATGTCKGTDNELAELYDETEEGDNTSTPNVVYATLASLLPLTAAKAPEVSITPSEAVEPDMYEVIRGFTRTAEIVTNRALRKGRYKKKLRTSCMSTFITAIGWLKVMYQRDYRNDPIIQSRIDDTQNNIAEIQRLIDATNPENRDADAEDREANLLLLQQQVAALEQKVEVMVAEGFVFDHVLTDDILVDDKVIELEDYRDADWMAHGTWMSIDDIKRKFSLSGEKWDQELSAASSTRRPEDGGSDRNQVSPIIMPTGTKMPAKGTHMLRVWEIWDRISQNVYTLIIGCKCWAREPWVPMKQGHQWFPFFPLIFNPVDGRRQPLSDVEQIAQLQDEYAETRSGYRDHRKKTTPGLVGRKGDFSKTDVEKLNSRATGEMVLIDGPDEPSKPVSASFGPIAYAPVDPALYDTSLIRADMEMISGLQSAISQNTAVKQKTATEAGIVEQNKSTRTGDRQDCVEDLTQDVAEFIVEVALQEMSLQQVQRIAGLSAVWPQEQPSMPGQPPSYIVVDQKSGYQMPMTREDIYTLVQIEIRAGSSGKPNKLQEREGWLKLYPVIQQSIAQITQLRMQGLFDLADAQKELLKEMLRRMDERIDVERFLPNIGMMAPGMPGQQGGGMPMTPGAPPSLGGPQPPGPPGAGMLDALMAGQTPGSQKGGPPQGNGSAPGGPPGPPMPQINTMH